MTKSDESKFVELYNHLQASLSLASDLQLTELKPLFRYASDQVSGHFHARGHSPMQEVNSLTWNEAEWPAASAILLEMKAMILKLEEKSGEPEAKITKTVQSPERELVLSD